MALAKDPVQRRVRRTDRRRGRRREGRVEAALDAGKHVVTANKALLAKHGVELAKLAEKNGVALNFEAAVAGGIPVIKTLREALAANDVQRVYGILNGTCNYILTKMQSEKRAFADVLKEAQAQGLRRSRSDLRHRRLRYRAQARAADEPRVRHRASRSTRSTSKASSASPQADIEAADSLGYRIKLLGVAVQTESGIEARVSPALVYKDSAIAEVSGVTNAVAIDGDFSGNILLVGAGAGAKPTASAVAERHRRHRARLHRAAVRAADARSSSRTSAPSSTRTTAPTTCASRSTTSRA